jgi:hypothetical protein
MGGLSTFVRDEIQGCVSEEEGSYLSCCQGTSRAFFKPRKSRAMIFKAPAMTRRPEGSRDAR